MAQMFHFQDIQAQSLLLSCGASWGDRPGHLVVPPSVTDVELQVASGPSTGASRGCQGDVKGIWIIKNMSIIVECRMYHLLYC